MTDITRRGAIFSISAWVAGLAFPAVTGGVAYESAAATEQTAMEMIQILLDTPLAGEHAGGAAFCITERGINDEFGGMKANIRWPEGDYGACMDNTTGNIIVYRMPASATEDDLKVLWSGGEPPHRHYRRQEAHAHLIDKWWPRKPT